MKGVNIERIIALGRRTGFITQGLIALWIGRAGHTAYLVYKQIRELCQDGILNTETDKCEVKGSRLVFTKLNGGSGGSSSTDGFLEYVEALKEGNYKVVEEGEVDNADCDAGLEIHIIKEGGG